MVGGLVLVEVSGGVVRVGFGFGMWMRWMRKGIGWKTPKEWKEKERTAVATRSRTPVEEGIHLGLIGSMSAMLVVLDVVVISGLGFGLG